jgi:hypothetical protein
MHIDMMTHMGHHIKNKPTSTPTGLWHNQLPQQAPPSTNVTLP